MRRELLQKERPPPLKIIKQEDPTMKSRKRQPVIIHTYSPEVINVEACNFMRIVQSLTGSSAASLPRPNKKVKPTLTEAPSLISIESPGSEANTSLDYMTEDLPDEGDSQYYRNPYSEGNLADGIPNLNYDVELKPHRHYNPNFNGNLYPNPNSNGTPNPISVFSTSARTTLLPPFAKPSPFLSRCGSFKQSPEPLSPFLWSPSLFDLSPSRLPSPSTFLTQLSPFPAVGDDSTSFVS